MQNTTVRRVYLNKQGYARNGVYFGLGRKLYWSEDFELYIRADSIGEARKLEAWVKPAFLRRNGYRIVNGIVEMIVDAGWQRAPGWHLWCESQQ